MTGHCAVLLFVLPRGYQQKGPHVALQDGASGGPVSFGRAREPKDLASLSDCQVFSTARSGRFLWV